MAMTMKVSGRASAVRTIPIKGGGSGQSDPRRKWGGGTWATTPYEGV
jgi:hypothetical protein